MGTGDYICVTLRGGAPWGFTLRQGEGDTYRPFHVIQGGRASLAGVRDGDEVVSLNGEPCADLTLTQAFNLIDCRTSAIKGTYCGARTSPDEALESTTLHILSSKHRSQGPRELYISESQDEAYYGEVESDTEFPKGPQLLCTQLQVPRSGNAKGLQPHYLEKVEGEQRSFSPGAMVELQVSLSEQTLEDIGCTSLGSARGIEGGLSSRENAESVHTTTHSLYVPCSVRKPLGQHGVVLRSPSMLGQVEVTLQHPATSGTGTGRGILTVGGGVGGPRASGSVGSQGEEGGGHSEGAPESFAVSFGVPSEEAAPAGEWDSDSEGDQGKPNKHRARHARLRRSESLSEKQVKEAKSKCKRIALLLTAAPPNPNNKGVLMFKKHRQRAKKYTLVSYGTGENEPEYEDEEDEEDEDNKKDTHTVEFTLVATSDSELDENFFTNAQGDKGVITLNWDKGLLEIERKLNSQEEMECLPETKGKGALMFAQRRQRVDEISAQHEELRRQGIAVEGVQIAEKRMEEQSYMQGTTEGHQFQQFSSNMNGIVHHQTSEVQSSFNNRTAKPFSVQNMVPTPYAPAISGTNQDAVGQGEQIASRDERISTPAIKTGLLQDTRRRNTGKPMFTFKEAPKVSPNPELLNLLNKSDKKGFESGPEEDYLSLGAEACNFLQSPRVKHKTPPPVAPKPMINPNCPPWSSQIVETNQDMPQHAENSVSTPAVAPTAETTPAPELQVAQPSPKPWQPAQTAPPHRTPPPPPQRMTSYTFNRRSSSPVINPMATVLNPSSAGSAFEMPAVRGKGADLFAKRQSRMEKFIVDSETVQANKTSRSTSPTASLPNEWKYSPNVRAPPPLSYNPIQSPSYPPAAIKQPPPSSPSAKAKKKGKEKEKATPKPLNVIDVMKHQPYQLNSSLFTYGPAQSYGMPPQPVMHDVYCHQAPANAYPPANPYQQAPAGPYQQAYSPQYQQAPPAAYQPQAPQSPNPPYQQVPQAPCQPANSPPYLAAPMVPYQAQPPSAYVALGRSYSLSPPARAPCTSQKSASASSSPRPSARASIAVQERQTSWMERSYKPPTPWEAASRHPLGLVDEAFAFQNLQHAIASNVRLAAQRKMLPEPPVEWKARVSYQAPQKTGSQTWSQSQSRSQSRVPLPSFVSPTKSTVCAPVSPAGYRSLPRQWQPHRSMTDTNLKHPMSSSEYKKPLGKPTYKAVYTSNTTWSWKQ
uniref:Synaptopodin 2 n=1 Tax=Myripristis murdjan TaxID=586833 RepID=A0A667YFJ3_9TELE